MPWMTIPSIGFYVTHARDLPLRNCVADVAILIEVLKHVDDPRMLSLRLKE